MPQRTVPQMMLPAEFARHMARNKAVEELFDAIGVVSLSKDRVRVTRTIVLDGEAEAVADTLQNSQVVQVGDERLPGTVQISCTALSAEKC